MGGRAGWSGWMLAALVAAGCAAPAVTVPPAKPSPPPSGGLGFEQRGYASWYGEPHHGRRTANGEVYDMRQLTAAHRTLPFGTRVLVTNVDNGRSVEVRINDRGPFVDGRILDLSQAAAERLGATARGIIPVQLRVVATPEGGR